MWAIIHVFFTSGLALKWAKDMALWFAFRGFMILLLTTTFPIVMHNLFLWALKYSGKFINYAMGTVAVPEAMQAQVLHVTGLLAYFCNCFQLPQCFVIIMVFMAYRLIFVSMMAVLGGGKFFF